MKKVIKIIELVPFAIILLSTTCYASDLGIDRPHIDTGLLGNLGGIISIIRIIGTAVAVGASIYLGMKYMIASVEEKANIKKKWVPFVVGAVIFFGATGILQLISAVAGWFS